jgi:protein phosphatase
MPWSAKAAKLLEQQYSCVGRAGRNGIETAVNLITQAAALHKSSDKVDLGALAETYKERKNALELYTEAYRRYCWDVESVEDYKIAPFHILATEAKVWNEESHVVHMETIKKYITGYDEIFMATDYIIVDLLDEKSVSAAAGWWEELTASGGEGMVVKPLGFTALRGTELLQPAVKCRGKEYLRIIYGPEYTLGGNLNRLKKRSLSKKRALALNEFALGIESLERFVRNEPLYRTHECVFGVLALESEPVDPRL